jgi:hydrogenase-4 component B
MTLASFFLIRFDHRQVTIRRGANKYLLLMELAWISILAGSCLIPGIGLGDPLHMITEKMEGLTSLRQMTIVSLILLGFGLKAGVFPLGQLWLPDAHSVAPSPISALLSGVMIKTGVYGIVRTLFVMLPASMMNSSAFPWGLVVASFGAVTLFVGTTQALKQHDAKRLHAYHSIGQMGYIILGLGAAHYFYQSGIPGLQLLAALSLLGALYHTINHAIFKGLLFLCTGSVQYATGTKDLNELGGLLKYMPLTAGIAAIASASIAGIPAFSGFMSKWSIISSSLLVGHNTGIFVIFGIIALMTSAITLASYVKFFGMTFTAVGVEWGKKKDVHEVNVMMLAPKIILAILCLAQGLLPWIFLGGLLRVFQTTQGTAIQGIVGLPNLMADLSFDHWGVTLHLPAHELTSAAAMPLILILLLLFLWAGTNWIRKAGGSKDRTAPVWLGGYQLLNNLNRYRSSNMYASFKHFMKWVGGNPEGH